MVVGASSMGGDCSPGGGVWAAMGLVDTLARALGRRLNHRATNRGHRGTQRVVDLWI